jgi:AmiR/NasT family two-component response regulator
MGSRRDRIRSSVGCVRGEAAECILIERYKITSQEAFRLLVVASQTTNIKLYDVAEYLVRTGALASPKP